MGQLLLYGFSGTTQPSPVDVREVGDGSRLVAVFGRDIAGCPEKYTIVCKDMQHCDALKKSINRAVLVQ